MTLIHATGIWLDGKGVLLRGPSGSGKSELALRLMGLGAELVGDDYVEVSRAQGGLVIMKAPPNISGLIEVRHVGILAVPFRPMAEVDLVLDLVSRRKVAQLDRLPEQKTTLIEAVAVPCLDFDALAAAAPEKLRAALKILSQT
ncbi:MAG: hypothetical protein COB54_08980 [Alphaproteobacteria bacterium]|nr:MAG: hypothetical protein COB54_08980 [Alphaproteobacteria bacterium]